MPVPSDNRRCCRGRYPSPTRLDLSICRLRMRGVRAVGGVRLECRPNQPHNAMVPSCWPCLKRYLSHPPFAGRLPRSTTRLLHSIDDDNGRAEGSWEPRGITTSPGSIHLSIGFVWCLIVGNLGKSSVTGSSPRRSRVRPQKRDVMMCRLQRRRGLLSASHVLRSAKLVVL